MIGPCVKLSELNFNTLRLHQLAAQIIICIWAYLAFVTSDTIDRIAKVLAAEPLLEDRVVVAVAGRCPFVSYAASVAVASARRRRASGAAARLSADSCVCALCECFLLRAHMEMPYAAWLLLSSIDRRLPADAALAAAAVAVTAAAAPL